MFSAARVAKGATQVAGLQDKTKHLAEVAHNCSHMGTLLEKAAHLNAIHSLPVARR